MFKFKFLLISCLALSIIGCAAHRMALTKGQTDVDLRKKSIALLSVKTSNEIAPAYQFDLIGFIVCPQSEECSNPRPYLHKANSPYRSKKDRYNEYLVSLELEPGTYYLRSIAVVYSSLLTDAGGYTPLNLKIDIKQNTISYLGHIDFTLRKKKTESEKTAGREQVNVGLVVRTELKDKSIVGFSTGTVDIFIEDKYDEDMKLFISEYPALQNVKVDKSILPQWIRPENQGAN